MTLPGKPAKDRRIRKTKALLHEALFSLILEKSYESIVVNDILDRADVGRSTFYSHFSDKDDLLVSGMHDMLHSIHPAQLPASARPYEQIIWFSLPIFEHIDEHRRASIASIGPRGRAVIHEHLQRVLAELIADGVMKRYRSPRKAAARMPPDIIVQYIASTFILVMNWWLEKKSPLPPKKINELFQALILPTLAAVLE
jgi:AcrR family transcriptional regulator